MDILVNTVWRACAELRSTDSSNVDQAEEYINSVARFSADVEYTANVAAAGRRMVYVETGGSMTYDSVVVTRADRLNGKNVKITDWATYTSTSTDRFSSASFAETLVGPNSLDWVWQIDPARTSREAIGLLVSDSGTFWLELNKFYACIKLTLNHVVKYRQSTLPRNTKYFSKGYPFTVDRDFTITFQHVTDAELATLKDYEELMRDGFFLYDSDGTWISYNLIHLVLESVAITKEFDDLNTVVITSKRLRQLQNTVP